MMSPWNKNGGMLIKNRKQTIEDSKETRNNRKIHKADQNQSNIQCYNSNHHLKILSQVICKQ
jgi:hypothetical protein